MSTLIHIQLIVIKQAMDWLVVSFTHLAKEFKMLQVETPIAT